MGLKKRSKVSAEFNMSSLTDIIFLLLIFFMLTSSLVNPTAINLKLPASSSKPSQPSTAPINVVVDASRRISVDGQIASLSSLNMTLLSIVKNRGVAAEETATILDIDPTVDAQTLVSVVDAINDSGTKMIFKIGK